jgi:hypothetical protein
MRIWFSGPRILGGMIRPGISFSLSEITRLTQRGRASLPVRREDVIVSRKEGPGLNMRVDLAPEALARIAEAPELPPPPKFAGIRLTRGLRRGWFLSSRSTELVISCGRLPPPFGDNSACSGSFSCAARLLNSLPLQMFVRFRQSSHDRNGPAIVKQSNAYIV